MCFYGNLQDCKCKASDRGGTVARVCARTQDHQRGERHSGRAVVSLLLRLQAHGKGRPCPRETLDISIAHLPCAKLPCVQSWTAHNFSKQNDTRAKVSCTVCLKHTHRGMNRYPCMYLQLTCILHFALNPAHDRKKVVK